MAKLKITLMKSIIACKQDQVATVKALGLHKIHAQVIQPDNACTRGMVFKVKHMVTVEEIGD